MQRKYGGYINRLLSILVAIYGVVEKDSDLILRSLAVYLVIIPCIWFPGKVNSLMAGRVYRGSLLSHSFITSTTVCFYLARHQLVARTNRTNFFDQKGSAEAIEPFQKLA